MSDSFRIEFRAESTLVATWRSIVGNDSSFSAGVSKSAKTGYPVSGAQQVSVPCTHLY